MKSLEARQAERKQREEDAKKNVEQANAIRASGTMADKSGAGSEETEEGYDSWTVADLKTELDNREIEYAASAKKADLVQLLEDDDGE